MTVVNFFTYYDTVRHLTDYLGADVEPQAQRDARRAALAAYKEFATAARWTYYYNRGRVVTVAPLTTGTVTYTQSNLQMTLTGATWPSWAQYGVIVINNISYDVTGVVSSTVITLSTNSNPGADITTPTAYTLYRDTYPLPADCVAIDSIIDVGNFLTPVYVHPRYWLDHQRLSKSPARPRIYSITGDPHFFGTMACRLYPPPDNIYDYDFIYQRRPRAIRYDEVSSNTVANSTIAVTQNSAVVTGTGTNWTSALVGSVLRNSVDNTNFPTGLEGTTPYDQERVILSVASQTSLTVDATYPSTYSGVLYCISDPIDIEAGAMLNCFLRCAEKQAAYTRKMKPDVLATVEGNWRNTLIAAREADARHFEEAIAGRWGGFANRTAYMPRGPDIS